MAHKKIIVLVLILAVIFTGGCDTIQNFNKEEYTLMTDIQGPADADNYPEAERKIVIADTGNEPKRRYYEKDRIKLEPKMSNIFQFDGWIRNGKEIPAGEDNILDFLIVKDTHVTAKFKFAEGGPYPVNITEVNGGSVSKEPDQKSYKPETPLTVTANPDNNYVFSHWIVTGENSEEWYESNPLTLGIGEKTTIKPVFYSNTDDNPPVELSDKEVEKVVREKLNKPVGLILQNEIRSITKLNLASKSIDGTLPDLPEFENLKELDLRGLNSNSLDLKNLGSLSVEVLKLSENDNINNLTTIRDMNNLKVLKLNNTSLENNDIEKALYSFNLKNLEELYLANNLISDITPLEKLSNLQILDLKNNQVNSLSSLSGMNDLRELYLSDNKITAINRDDISNWDSIVILDLSNKDSASPNNAIDDTGVANLGDLPNNTLEKLYLSGNTGITNFNNLGGITNLKEIYLSNAGITKITDAQGDIDIGRLDELDLSKNNITDISALNQLNFIGTLDLSENSNLTKIDSLDPANDIDLNTLKLFQVPYSSDIEIVVDKLEDAGTEVKWTQP